jgi:hypothetical protein
MQPCRSRPDSVHKYHLGGHAFSVEAGATLIFGVGVVTMVVAAPLTENFVAQASSGPQVVGQKYSDASTALSGAGFTAVVSTTVGDQLSWPNCVVTQQQVRTIPAQENTGGSATNQMLVSLDCDAAVASATSPGNSLASPAGRAAAASAAAAAAASATPTAKS